jgi:hypothetical protein
VTPAARARAVAVALAAAAMFVLATPGMDGFGDGPVPDDANAWEAFWRRVNTSVRMPVVRALEPLQPPLRLHQGWSLYPSGPNKVRRMEIRVDGALVYRSNDGDADWLAAVLRYRRVRPVVASTCLERSRNDVELIGYIVRRARADFPDVSEVEVRCTIEPWPEHGPKPPRVVVRYTARAPDFAVQP